MRKILLVVLLYLPLLSLSLADTNDDHNPPAQFTSTPTASSSPVLPGHDLLADLGKKLRFQLGTGLDILGQNFNTANRASGLGGEFSIGYTANDHWSFWLDSAEYVFPEFYSENVYRVKLSTEFYELLVSSRYSFGDKDLKLYLTAGYGFLKIESGDAAIFSNTGTSDEDYYYYGYYGRAIPAAQFGLGLEWRWSSLLSLFVEAKENFLFPTFYVPDGVLGPTESFTAMEYPLSAGLVLDLWGGQGSAPQSQPLGNTGSAPQGNFFLKMGGGIAPQPYWYGIPPIVNTSLAAGYDFPDSFSLFASLEQFPGVWAALANLQVTFPIPNYFNPYLFGGVGEADIQSNDGLVTRAAFQLGCGLDFPLDRGKDLFAETKGILFDLETNSDLFYQSGSWDFLAGLKVNFPETVPTTELEKASSSETKEAGRLFVQAAWGFDLPAQNWQSAYTSGGGGKFCAGYEFKDGLTFQLDLEDFDYSGSNNFGTIWDHELLILPTVRYFFHQKVIRPYLSAGAGLDWETSWDGFYDKVSEVGNFDAALGAGVEVPLDDRNSLFVEGKYNFIFANGVTGQDLPLFAGASFGFE